ncbi:hypothetical protein PMAYCL1PPCAC_29971, partial [Pristionchus mayeri]
LRTLTVILFLARQVSPSVYSCEEVRFWVTNSSFTQNTRYACLVTQEGFSNWNQLEKVYAQIGKYYTSLHDVATGRGGCIENEKMETPWEFFSLQGAQLDCTQEYTLILTSQLPRSSVFWWILFECWSFPRQACGFTREDVQGMKECDSMPDWIFTFDDVISLDVDPSVALTVECSSLLELDAMVMASPGESLAVLSSGRSDDLQNMEGRSKSAFVLIGEWEAHEVRIDMNLSFDPSNTGSIVLQKSWDGPEFQYYNGSHNDQFITSFFEVRYAPKPKIGPQIWHSLDNIIIEISIDDK